MVVFKSCASSVSHVSVLESRVFMTKADWYTDIKT